MRRQTAIPLVVIGVAALAAALIGLAIGGTPNATLVIDPGPLVRWGTPIATLLTNLAAATTVGSLVLLCFAVPRERPEFERITTLASASAAVWTIASIAAAVLAFAQAIGQPIRFDDAFSVGLWTYLTDTEAGQARAWGIVLVAASAVLLAMVRSYWGLAIAAIVGAAAFIPLSDLNHSGGNADHNVAWSAMFLHIAFAAVWLGGLVALAIVSRRGDRELAERFSSIALVSFIVVAASGLVSAVLRLGAPADLLTPYGVLVVVKVVALVGLGAIGAIHRRHAIRRLPDGRAFIRLVVAELVLMGIASGMAVALADTAPPLGPPPAGTSPAERLTGQPLPAPPTAEAYLFGFAPDVLWLAVCVALAAFYLLGVIRLARRGDRWPVLRTVSWLAGVLVLAWTTSGGIAAYVDKLFSAHMLAHMTLGMMIPVLLVPGAPITLALRAIRARRDGSRGPREWILALVHSPWFRAVGNPYVAAGIFVASLWIFYYTPLFSWASTTHLGHQWMVVHFLMSGYLFVQAVIGIDPAPNRPPFAVRLLLLLATMALHAFFGLALMMGTGLMLADWYGAMGWDIGVTALQDQQRAGGIAWSVGELPTLALAIVVAVQWARSDEREQRRRDRQADRDGDAELAAYNAMLAETAARDARAGDRPGPTA